MQRETLLWSLFLQSSHHSWNINYLSICQTQDGSLNWGVKKKNTWSVVEAECKRHEIHFYTFILHFLLFFCCCFLLFTSLWFVESKGYQPSCMSCVWVCEVGRFESHHTFMLSSSPTPSLLESETRGAEQEGEFWGASEHQCRATVKRESGCRCLVV